MDTTGSESWCQTFDFYYQSDSYCHCLYMWNLFFILVTAEASNKDKGTDQSQDKSEANEALWGQHTSHDVNRDTWK